MSGDALIGRNQELDERLRANRLVTVIGPGGAGKTALAAEAAVRQSADSRSGFAAST